MHILHATSLSNVTLPGGLTRNAIAPSQLQSEEHLEQPESLHIYPSLDSPLASDSGLEDFVGVASTDITERKRAEQALRECEARYRMVFEHSGTANAIFDTECRLVLQNSLSAQRLGTEQATGRSAAELLGPGAGEVVEERMRRIMASGNPETFETEFSTPEGPRWFRTAYEPIFDAAHTLQGVQTISVDITERKKLEAEREKLRADLFQAQKMEAIGTLAGGVAHDFNNILGGILCGLSQLELELGETANIRDMKALAKRGAELARQLLGFGRRGKYDAKPLALAHVLHQTGTIFGRTRRDVTVTCDLAPDLQAVIMDHAQLDQVLLNLFVNAGQAMPDGGRLLLRAENVTLAQGQAAPHGASPGRYVRLDVADTGVGMDTATQARIFEPFFTTKPFGQSSGLGLASVYGIITNHGGFITVESKPGEGAVFTIHLPAADIPEAEATTSAAAPHAARGTILVVDDEELLRAAFARLLRLLGYDVLMAGSGKEAVDIVREQRQTLSLVILDLTMPEMSGAATFEALRAIAPDLKVLLCSGFSLEGQARALLARGCNGFLPKPFGVKSLTAKLQALL